MRKHLIIQRSEGTDWYDKAAHFLSRHKCGPLELKVSSDVNPASVFQEALAYINETAGEQFKVDPDAAVFLVTADLSKVAGNGFPCQCECGSSGNCGGGGGGHSRARGDV